LNDYEAKYSDLPPLSRCPQCRSCGASLGYLPTPAKATEAWNRRVTAAAQAEIQRLIAALANANAGFEEHERKWYLEQDRATAAEARADRLLLVLGRIERSKSRTFGHLQSVARAALQQEG